MLSIGNKITADGRISTYTGKFDINHSSIFSELIQAAGMGCENFASDMFIELEAIKRAIDNVENYVRFIGIRTLGVDGDTFIASRLNRKSCNYEPAAYIKLYKLEISIVDDEMTMTLTRISSYDAARELVKDETEE